MSNQTGLPEPSSERTFLVIKGREFVLKAKAPQSEEEAAELLAQGFKKRDWTFGDKSGTAYEKRYPNITGQLKSTFESESDFGVDQKFVVFDANGESYQLSGSKYMNSQVENLMNRMCNDTFDPSKPVQLVPYKRKRESGNGYNEGVLIYHLDDKGRYSVKVEKAFTVDNPGDMPKWEKKKVSGKDKWNNDKAIEFLSGILEDKMKDVPDAVFPDPEVEAPSNDEGKKADLPF